MKSIQFILGILILGSFFLITSCNDKEDTEAPEVTVLSPTNNQNFKVGDTINIHYQVSENDELHGIEADLLNESGTQLWKRHMHEHTNFFEWEDQYIVNESDANQTLELTVWADDHNGNKSDEVIVNVAIE